MIVSTEFVKEKVAEFLKVPAGELREDMTLASLIADSFMIVEMMIELQEIFGICLHQEDLKDIHTLGELAAVIERASRSREADPGAVRLRRQGSGMERRR